MCQTVSRQFLSIFNELVTKLSIWKKKNICLWTIDTILKLNSLFLFIIRWNYWRISNKIVQETIKKYYWRFISILFHWLSNVWLWLPSLLWFWNIKTYFSIQRRFIEYSGSIVGRAEYRVLHIFFVLLTIIWIFLHFLDKQLS